MIAKNFKFLYRYYKDKQNILAEMLDVSQGTVSEFINGKKPIPTSILQRIATRYHVSVDDLINKDLSTEYDKPQIIELKDTMAWGDSFLPILKSNIAESNDNFNLALKLLLESMYIDIEKIDTIYGRISVFEHAISLFQKAWEVSKSYVALSNSISTILTIYSLFNPTGIEIGRQLVKKGKISTFEVQEHFLRDPREADLVNPNKQKQIELFKKYDVLVYDSIKLLKSNTQFFELGDHYLAICYFLGFAEDFITYEESVQTGVYMLFQLLKMENKYAEKFWENMPRLS